MRNLLRILVKFYPLLLFLTLEFIAFAMLFNYNTYHRAAYLNASSALTGGINERIQRFKDFFILVKANEQLADENARIKNTLVSSYKSNRVSFSEIYDSVYEQYWKYIDCKIVYNSTGRQHNMLMIDKGSRHGIEPEMGLVSGKGVVGIIQHVSKNYSTASSILNTNVIISAKLKSSDHFGILKWDGNDTKYCYLSDIPNHIKIENGDTIVTSGYSSIFPEGIIIGIAVDVDKSFDLSFFNIKVKLTEDFGAITHLYAVKNLFKNEIDSLKNLTEND
jgi:rod shape-determining protein MreC